MTFKHALVAVGGTFDRLHKGHEALLGLAFRISEKVSIGVTSDDFVTEKEYAELILPYPERVEELKRFLKDRDLEGRYELVKLEDIYGTTLSDGRIEAIVVSEQTRYGARAVNDERERLGKERLPVEVAEMVRDKLGKYLSSTRIRQGLVSRAGVVYGIAFASNLELSDRQKLVLKEPMGRLVSEKDLTSLKLDGFTRVAVVGDESLRTFRERGLEYSYGVYDGKSMRKGFSESGELARTFKVKNPAGKILKRAVDDLEELFNLDQGLLEVDGEEDLLVLPVILGLPLGSVVVYGQPNEGLVVVEVNEESKQKWYEFLR